MGSVKEGQGENIDAEEAMTRDRKPKSIFEQFEWWLEGGVKNGVTERDRPDEDAPDDSETVGAFFSRLFFHARDQRDLTERHCQVLEAYRETYGAPSGMGEHPLWCHFLSYFPVPKGLVGEDVPEQAPRSLFIKLCAASGAMATSLEGDWVEPQALRLTVRADGRSVSRKLDDLVLPKIVKIAVIVSVHLMEEQLRMGRTDSAAPSKIAKQRKRRLVLWRTQIYGTYPFGVVVSGQDGECEAADY